MASRAWPAPILTPTITWSAPTAAAARNAPSSTRCGALDISSASLELVGSPSLPFARMIGVRRPDATACILTAVGKPAPPRPCSPAASTTSISSSSLLRQVGGGAANRDRCAASIAPAVRGSELGREAIAADRTGGGWRWQIRHDHSPVETAWIRIWAVVEPPDEICRASVSAIRSPCPSDRDAAMFPPSSPVTAPW